MSVGAVVPATGVGLPPQAAPSVAGNDLMRFVLGVDAEFAHTAYQLLGDTIIFIHTFVPEALRGRGLAMTIVRSALQASRSRGLKVVPRCPVFRAYMTGHPETHDLLAPEGLALLGHQAVS